MPLVLVPLAILLTAFVAYGTAFLARSQGSAWANWVKDALGATFLVGDILTQAAVNLTKWIAHEVGAHFGQVEFQTVQWLAALGNAIDYSAQSIAGIGYDLHRFSRWLVLQEIPKLIHALPNAVTTVVHGITKRIVTVERTVVKLPGLTKAQVRAAVAVAIPGIIAHDLPYFEWLKKHLKTLERIAAGAAGTVIGAAIPIPKDLLGIRTRIGKIEKSIVGVAAAGLVATALARLGVTWIRCNNWKRLGRGICNLPASAISSLLSLLTDVFLLADICEVVKLLQDAYAEVEQPIATLVGDVGGALCHGDFDAPPVMEVPAVNLWNSSQIAA